MLFSTFKILCLTILDYEKEYRQQNRLIGLLYFILRDFNLLIFDIYFKNVKLKDEIMISNSSMRDGRDGRRD